VAKDEFLKAMQPSEKGVGEFIPLNLSDEEKSMADVEHNVMTMLAQFRDRIESRDEDREETENSTLPSGSGDESTTESKKSFGTNEDSSLDCNIRIKVEPEEMDYEEEEEVEIEVEQEEIEESVSPKRAKLDENQEDLREKILSKRVEKSPVDSNKV
jgi:hypothetical protein